MPIYPLVNHARLCLFDHSEIEEDILAKIKSAYMHDTGKDSTMSINDLLTYLCSIERLPKDAMLPKENRQPSEIN